MELKTSALDSSPAVVERKEFNRGYNDGQRVDSAATDTGKYWTSTSATVDLFGCWAGRNEASGRPGHCPNPK